MDVGYKPVLIMGGAKYQTYYEMRSITLSMKYVQETESSVNGYRFGIFRLNVSYFSLYLSASARR